MFAELLALQPKPASFCVSKRQQVSAPIRGTAGCVAYKALPGLGCAWCGSALFSFHCCILNANPDRLSKSLISDERIFEKIASF